LKRLKSQLGAEFYFGFIAFLAVAALIIGVFTIKCSGGANLEYATGSRSGVVQKISKKGMIWKTWEGELNLGYNTASSDGNGHTTIAPAIFRFSVESEDVAREVQAAAESGKRVTLEYVHYFLRGYDKGGTSYDVVGVIPPR
jgi:hypothetical protein